MFYTANRKHARRPDACKPENASLYFVTIVTRHEAGHDRKIIHSDHDAPRAPFQKFGPHETVVTESEGEPRQEHAVEHPF